VSFGGGPGGVVLTSLQALVCALQGNLPTFFYPNFSPTLFLTMAPSTPPLND